MNLLYFATHQLWPLTTGARLRDYHMARQLAKHCRVTFVEVLHPDDDPTSPPPNTDFERVVTVKKDQNFRPSKMVRGLIGPMPVTLLNYHSPAIARALTEVLEQGEFDIVQLENVHLCVYLPEVRAARSRPTALGDWHNVDSELLWRYAAQTPSLARKLVARRSAQLLERMEARLLRRYDALTVPSQREKDKLVAMAPDAPIEVIPNGVDSAHYGDIEAEGRTLLFVGAMDYHANVTGIEWFVREVWPEIAAAYPDLDFYIVGRNPVPAVRELAGGRVHVTGTVDDVRPYYKHAAAVVAPLLIGSGTRLKILEAMAAGVPVVSTKLGAEGIDCEDGVHLLLAETAQEMAASVKRLLGSQETRLRLRAAARRLVSAKYDWSALGKQMYAIHERLMERRRAMIA